MMHSELKKLMQMKLTHSNTVVSTLIRKQRRII